jgi:hypothetical protein
MTPEKPPSTLRRPHARRSVRRCAPAAARTCERTLGTAVRVASSVGARRRCATSRRARRSAAPASPTARARAQTSRAIAGTAVTARCRARHRRFARRDSAPAGRERTTVGARVSRSRRIRPIAEHATRRAPTRLPFAISGCAPHRAALGSATAIVHASTSPPMSITAGHARRRAGPASSARTERAHVRAASSSVGRSASTRTLTCRTAAAAASRAGQVRYA